MDFIAEQARTGLYTVHPDGNIMEKSSAPPLDETPVEGAKPKKYWDIFPNSPSDAYRHKIASGLNETHGLTLEQSNVYFNGSTGVVPHNS